MLRYSFPYCNPLLVNQFLSIFTKTSHHELFRKPFKATKNCSVARKGFKKLEVSKMAKKKKGQATEEQCNC